MLESVLVSKGCCYNEDQFLYYSNEPDLDQHYTD